MQVLDLDGLRLHIRDEGAGAPVLFLHALGTDLRLWDRLLPLLPGGLRLVRVDMRGHGLSDCPPAPYAMGGLVRDAERLCDALGLRGAAVVGLSIGGLIAQGLAIKRPEIVQRLVLSNTAAKIGTPALWHDRIAAVRAGGLGALADGVMARWFPAAFRATPELALWRNMLLRTPVEGYAGCCTALAGADFTATTATLRLPLLAIAGSEDGSTPPDLVRETAGLVPGARFALIRGAGHLPCVDRPEDYAAILSQFLRETGHV